MDRVNRTASIALLEKRQDAIVFEYGDITMTLVGFILDQPINMMGNDGWETIRKQVEGK